MAEPIHDPESEALNRRAATLSVAYNVALTVIKLAAALFTGSVSLLSEAVHSATDIVASFIAFLSVRAASVPPDDEHPYGHGKIESLAGLSESVLLLVIVVYIVVEAIQRLIHGGEVGHLELGLGVMVFSSITSFIAGRYVGKVADRTGSLALRSNGQHLMVDFWTSVGVLLALGITRVTGWQQADSVFAIVLALWIAFGAIRISYDAVNELIDRRLPEEEEAKVRAILDESKGCLSYHRLRTRHSGQFHYIDVHIVVPNEWSLTHAHDLAEEIEKKIQREVPPAHVVIHVDPFDYGKSRKSLE
jgi:cation diffusion facilitator family transporter